MGIFGNALDWVLAFILFSLLLFIHESGHYIMARLTGVKVEEFGFGFPPRVLKLFTWKGTDFTLNAIPFGAFVRPSGEDDPSVPGGLGSSSKKVRTAVLLGGVLANLLVAILCFTVVYKVAFPEPNVVVVAEVAADTPAAQSGLMAGDRIISADGISITSSDQLVQYVHTRLGQPVQFVVSRGGQEVALEITPRTTWPSNQGPTGMVLSVAFSSSHSWLEAAGQAVSTAWQQVKLILSLPEIILRGGFNPATDRPVGPVGILDITEQIVGNARTAEQWLGILQWLGIINLALAVGNILPIPAFDGGRLLFVLIEAVRGKPVNPERERMIHATTLIMLLFVMVFVTYLDLFYPVLPR
jgi:regulator of sigma E protease